MPYHEFKLRVPIWDISNHDEGNTPAIRSLFSLLSVTPPNSSLASLYNSFYDNSAAEHIGDPAGRFGRGVVLIFISETDENSFIAIDMFLEATDQMNTVEIGICAPESCANEVAAIMKSIRLSAEVASALLEGNLGMRGTLSRNGFPRVVTNHKTEVIQHAQFFRGGKLIDATGPAQF